MSQLIALIIAIALGAIITAIGYVYFGDIFTNKNQDAQAQQIINQAKQLENIFTAYKAQNLKSAFDTDQTTTYQNLIDSNYLKSDVVAPFGNYDLIQFNDRTFLTLHNEKITKEFCWKLNELLIGKDKYLAVYSDIFQANHMYTRTIDLGSRCFKNDDNNEHYFSYLVE